MDRSETAAASAVEWGGIAPEFPAGLRVLVVDDDATCLKVIERMLKNCLYDVTTCSQAVAALSILRERKGGFDIVLSDVYMPDMDGFKLLELIGLEMDLPVIMMSAEDRQDVVLKGVTHGACDYLIKPIRMEAVKTLWQHVVRKRRNESRDQDHSGSVDDSDRQRKSSEDGENGSSATDGNWKHVKRKKEEEDDAGEEHEDTSTMKKPRVVWTIELHQQFVAAVNQLGVDKAVPKKILEMMNVPVLTRENVASHLQKYRLYLRRVSGGSQRHGRVDTPFSGASETSFGLITSSDGIHLPTLSVSSHVPPQNFSMLQAGPRNGINASIRSNQMSFLNFEKSTMPSQLKSLAGQQLIVGQMNMLNGLPSSMNSQQVLLPTTGLQQLSHSQQMMRPCMGLQVNAGKNIAGLTTSSKICSPYQVDITQGPMDNPLWMQITPQMHNVPIDLHQKIMRTSVQQHPQPRFLMLNEPVPSSILSPIIGRESEVTTPVREQNEVVSSPHMPSEGVCINNASMVCSTSQSPYADYRSNCYPVGGTVTTPNLAPADMFQKSMQTSGSLERQSSAPCYAILNETGKNSQNSKFQNMNYNHQSTNHLSSAQTGVHFGALEVVPKAVQNRNLYAQSQDIIRDRAEDKQLQRSCEHVDTQQLADNSFKIKIESLHNSGYGNLQIADGFYSDELMKAVTKKQEMVGHGEEEFSIERFFS